MWLHFPLAESDRRKKPTHLSGNCQLLGLAMPYQLYLRLLDDFLNQGILSSQEWKEKMQVHFCSSGQNLEYSRGTEWATRPQPFDHTPISDKTHAVRTRAAKGDTEL